MSYSKLYFGKELIELAFADIENYFVDAKEESDKIEFKSYHSHNPEEKNHAEKEKGILRTICGLLNSEGGLIIWGAPSGQSVSGQTEKVFQGKLSPCDRAIGKDSFINKVADTITPTPNGVKFQPIEKNGQYVYIIEVEQSFYSPHQFKYIYYMRMDGQTKPAPHHYIEALFRKVTFPKLEGIIEIERVHLTRNQCFVYFSCSLKNKSMLQNEFNISFKIKIAKGRFINHKLKPNKEYTQFDTEIVNFNARETLFYKDVLIEHEVLLLQLEELIGDNNQFEISFLFGGKQSPLMISKSKFELDSDNAINEIKIIRNKYLYELEEDVN